LLSICRLGSFISAHFISNIKLGNVRLYTVLHFQSLLCKTSIGRSLNEFNDDVFCAAGLHPGAIAAIVIGKHLLCLLERCHTFPS